MSALTSLIALIVGCVALSLWYVLGLRQRGAAKATWAIARNTVAQAVRVRAAFVIMAVARVAWLLLALVSLDLMEALM